MEGLNGATHFPGDLAARQPVPTTQSRDGSSMSRTEVLSLPNELPNCVIRAQAIDWFIRRQPQENACWALHAVAEFLAR